MVNNERSIVPAKKSDNTSVLVSMMVATVYEPCSSIGMATTATRQQPRGYGGAAMDAGAATEAELWEQHTQPLPTAEATQGTDRGGVGGGVKGGQEKCCDGCCPFRWDLFWLSFALVVVTVIVTLTAMSRTCGRRPPPLVSLSMLALTNFTSKRLCCFSPAPHLMGAPSSSSSSSPSSPHSEDPGFVLEMSGLTIACFFLIFVSFVALDELCEGWLVPWLQQVRSMHQRALSMQQCPPQLASYPATKRQARVLLPAPVSIA
jgi:hypothetical protein